MSKDGIAHRFHNGQLRVLSTDTVLLAEMRDLCKSTNTVTEDKELSTSPAPAAPKEPLKGVLTTGQQNSGMLKS